MNTVLKNLNEKGEEYILVAMLSLTVILVILQVIFRYVLQMSLGWSEEIARYSLIWMTWISTSYAVKRGSHIRVELIKNFLSDKLKKYLEIVVLLLWFILAFFIAYQGTLLISTLKVSGQVSPSTQLPIWLVYLASPIGATLMCFRLVQEFFKIIKQ